MFELMDSYSQSAVIKVLGVGGGGGNAVSHMVQAGLEGVDFICINTDAQALKHSKVRTALQIGCNITKGLGAGADPEVGRQAAMEDRDRIIELIEGCDMLFITAGMGGGTGTGAAPVVAQVAKELGILTVAVVTRPFEMEGNKRSRVADQGMLELSKYVDSLITIPNQKLLSVLGSSTTLLDAFKAANTVLQGAVQGIAELITRPGLINVDFADVRTVMSETGMAMMGSGSCGGRRSGARSGRGGDLQPAARGHQSLGRSRDPGQRHRGHGFVHRRVPGSRQRHQAIRFRRRDGGGGHGHRPGHGQPDPGHRRGHGSGQAGGDGPSGAAAADGGRGHRAAARPCGWCGRNRRWRRPTTPCLDKPTVQRQRAVGDGLRDGGRIGGFAGYSGVLAAAGGLDRGVGRANLH